MSSGAWSVEHRGPFWRVVSGSRVWGANRECTEAEALAVCASLNSAAPLSTLAERPDDNAVCVRCGKPRRDHFGKRVDGRRVHEWCYEFREDLSEAMRWAVFTPESGSPSSSQREASGAGSTVQKAPDATYEGSNASAPSVPSAKDCTTSAEVEALLQTIELLESRLSSLERELDGVRKDTERLDFLDDRTHLYETPVLDCYAGDQYEVTIGDAKDPLIGNGTSLREAIDAAMSALRERSE